MCSNFMRQNIANKIAVKMKHIKRKSQHYHSPLIHIFIFQNKQFQNINNMKTLFFFLVLTFSLGLTAQITKGNWLVGGSGEYTNQTYNYDDGDSFKREYITIKPNAGYFLKDKFAVGSALRFEKFDNANIYGIGLFSRYYFLKPNKPFNLFAQIHYDFVHTVSDLNINDKAINNSSFYGARIGQVVFFNNVVGIEFAMVYERGNSSSSNSETFKAVLGFQIHLEK